MTSTLGCGDGGDGGGTSSECGFENRYLPFAPGNTWEYRVTDLGTGIRSVKMQSLAAARVTDDGFPGEMFIEQTTIKATGKTVGKLQVKGDSVVRFVQEDFDDLGVSERVTVYNPGKLRLDESAERLMAGAMFTESYVATVTNATGSTPTSFTENWELISESAPCRSPLGSFDCIVVRRTRTMGGTSTKDFYFAEGIGKVREEGTNQLEELTACGR